MAIGYYLEDVRDDENALVAVLKEIVGRGERVVSVMWRPVRDVWDKDKQDYIETSAGFLIVAEFDR